MKIDSFSLTAKARQAAARPQPLASSGPASPAEPIDESACRPQPVSQAGRPKPSRSVLYHELQKAGLFCAGASVGGPVGAALSDAGSQALRGLLDDLADEEVYFYQDRPADHPEGPGYELMTSEQTAGFIESHPADVITKVRVYPGQAPYPLKELRDLQLLDALFLSPAESGAPQAHLAEAITSLRQHGHRTLVDDDALVYCYDYGETPPPLLRPETEGELNCVGQHPLGVYRHALGLEQLKATVTPEGTWASQKATPANLIALDFFHGSGEDRGLERPELAAQMRELSRRGYTFSPHSGLDNHISTDRYRDFTTYRGMLAHPDEQPWLFRKGAENEPVFSFPVAREMLADPSSIDERYQHVQNIWDGAYPRFAHIRGSARVVPEITRRLLAEFPEEQREAVCEGITGLIADEAVLPAERRQNLKEMLDEGLDFLARLSPRLEGADQTTQIVKLLGMKYDAQPLRARAAIIEELLDGGKSVAELGPEFTARVVKSGPPEPELEFRDDAIEIGGFDLPRN